MSKSTAARYQRSRKKEKGFILDEYVALTGYNRTYASHILANWGKKKTLVHKQKRITFEIIRESPRRRKKPIVYGPEIKEPLVRIWAIADGICGKRLAPLMPELIPKLEHFGEIKLDAQTRQKLLSISAATIDRLLASEKKKMRLKARSHTKPGTLLKHQIPIRTFSDWDDTLPGFVEVDLVGHDGGNAAGEFAYTLDITDIVTTWIELVALKNKAHKWVLEALTDVSHRLPFPLLGIDSDNGGEFINNSLVVFCQANEINFTRTRPYKKNDNCYVEQKNYSVVRRAVWYNRYDTDYQVKLMNQLYGYLRLYINFFQPSMKLKEKTRIGSRVKKKFDTAKTPFQRVLEHPAIDQRVKESLKKQYELLNPAELKRKIVELQTKLEKSVLRQKQSKHQRNYYNRGYHKLRRRNDALA